MPEFMKQILSIWIASDISISRPSVCIPRNSSLNRCGGWWTGRLPALVGPFSSAKEKRELQVVWSLWWFDPRGMLASRRMWSSSFPKTAAASESAVFWEEGKVFWGSGVNCVYLNMIQRWEKSLVWFHVHSVLLLKPQVTTVFLFFLLVLFSVIF